MADPRLPALGWRGYGLVGEVDTDEAAYDAHRLDLGFPIPPATARRTRPSRWKPTTTF